MPKQHSGYAECQFCEQAHQWYSIPTLAAQFDVVRKRFGADFGKLIMSNSADPYESQGARSII